MALNWQKIRMALAGPMDQATDAKVLDPAERVASAINVRYLKDGVVAKAHGYDAISYRTPEYESGVQDGVLSAHSLLSAGGAFYVGAYHTVQTGPGASHPAGDFCGAFRVGGGGSATNAGAWCPVVVSRREVVRHSYTGDSFRNINSVVAAGGYLWAAWNEEGVIYYSVSDEATGVVVVPATALPEPGGLYCYGLRVVTTEAHVYIFRRYDTGTLRLSVLDATDPTATASTATVTTSCSGDCWDACYYANGANRYAVLAYRNSGTGYLELARFQGSTTPGAAATDTTTVLYSSAMACCGHYDSPSSSYLVAVAAQLDDGGSPDDVVVRAYTSTLSLDSSGVAVAVADLGGSVTGLAISTEVADAGSSVSYSAMVAWVDVAKDDGVAAAAAELLLSGTHIDTTIYAHTAGYDGNRIDVALIGDSAPAAGVVISRSGRAMNIHFEAGVSTRADVETAIGALAGSDDIIDVGLSGSKTGALTVSGDSMSLTQLHGGYDAWARTTRRVKPAKMARVTVPSTMLVSIGAGDWWEGYRLSSRAVAHRDRSHVWLRRDSEEWPFLALVTTGPLGSATWGRYTEAIFLQGIAEFLTYKSISSAWTSGDKIIASAVAENEDGSRSILAITADYSIMGLRQATVGGCSLVGGTQLMCLDGECRPHGFAHYPEILSYWYEHGPAITSGPLEGATYKYLAIYAWTDNNGLAHRSAPSLPMEVAIPARGQVSGLAPVITDENKHIEYCVLSMDTYGVVSMGDPVVVTLTPAAFDTPQLLAAQINTDLDSAGAPFRVLAGEAADFDSVTYEPHYTDRYELILLPTASAVGILFKTGTHGADEDADSFASLLGFDTSDDLWLSAVWTDRVPISGGLNIRLYEGAAASFTFTEPQEDTLVGLRIATLVAGDVPRNANDVKVEVFRTLADGSEYYLHSVHDNDPEASFIVISDLTKDEDIDEARQPYTTGEPNDVLENAHPVGHILWAHGDRIWVVDDEDPRLVWISKPVAVGIAPEFPYELQISMPEPIVAGASIGSHSLLFSASRCWAIGGDGPNAIGVGDWIPPRILSSDNGAIDHRCTCEVEGGVLVHGARGLYALQGSQATAIGREVEDLMDGAEVRAIVSRRGSREIWVFVEPSGGGAGYVVVYDYEARKWTKLEWGDISAAIEHSDLAYFASGTSIRVENPTGYDMAGIGYTHQVETGWLALAGLAGYQRVRRVHLIGTWRGSCTVAVEVFFDYAAAAAQTVSIPLLTQPSPDLLCRFIPSRQKCAAIRFRVTVTATAGATNKRGVDLHALELEIGTKGAFRRAAVSK